MKRAPAHEPDEAAVFEALYAARRGPVELRDISSVSPSSLDTVEVGSGAVDLSFIQSRYGCFVDIFDKAHGDVQGPRIAVKDVFAFRGHRPSAGVPQHAHDFVLPDSPAIERLLRAGAAIVGTTHLPPWCYLAVEDNPYLAPPRHPSGDEFLIGGSSGGAAVAVASGAVAAALGTDTGGSVRIPAALCGVYGFKPSRGRIEVEGVMPLSPTNDTVGILAADAPLLRTLFDVLKSDVTKATGDRSSASFAIPAGAFDRVDEEIARAGRLLRERLASLGLAEHETAGLPLVELNQCASVVTGFEAAAIHRGSLSLHPGDYQGAVGERLAAAIAIDADTYSDAMAERTRLLEYVMELCFGECDWLLLPVVNRYAPTREAVAAEGSAAGIELLSLNRWVNLIGLPALAIPVDVGAGLPASVQLVGRPYADEKLLDLAVSLSARP